jgi:phage baseplate assembly protein W
MAITTYYFDFSKKGQDILGTKDVPVIKNDQAIKESVLNLLATNVGERPMIPEYGINLTRFLFEPIDDITADLMSFEIERGLERFEPRINNIEVEVIPNEEELSFSLTISFGIAYSNSVETIEVDFKKIR